MEKKIIFGTDGWRGILDSEINDGTVAIAAQAFADYLINREKKHLIKTAIGYDGRKYSREFAEIFAQVLSGNDIDIHLSNSIIPTPVLSYYVKTMGFSAGVMITASHNPKEYNGIKFKDYYGGPFLTHETIKVESFLKSNPVKSNEENIFQTDFLSIYCNQLERLIDFDLLRRKNLNLLIDSMGGAGQQILENILSKHQISCKTIYKIAKPDFSGRQAEPIEINLAPLKERLQKGNFSFGIATDGDADRCGVMLEDGNWLSAQETILLLSDYLINVKKVSGALVKTSSVTDKLKAFFTASGREVFDVQVGFKYICEKMISADVAFGAEESGGFGYKNHIPERDGILSGLIIAEMLAHSGKQKLSDYLTEKRKQFGKVFYNRIDKHYNNEDRVDKLPELFSHAPKSIAGFKLLGMQEYFSSRGIINGLKLILGERNRWLLIRASETEPLIRLYAEGESDEEVQNILEAGKLFFP